jgi:23S rRNA (uracil1939-C5)-methyltransferase
VRKLLAAFKMTAWTPEEGGFLRHLLIRRGFATGQVMVVLVAGTPIFPSKKSFTAALLRAHPEITTVVFTVNDSETNLLLGKREEILYGEGYIEDTLCGLTFRISPRSFYQINPVQTEVLYKTAIEYAGLTGKERVLDAYCGIGTIGLAAAKNAGEVLGVEVNPDAVADAEKNAARNRIENAGFVCADAGEYMTELAEMGETVDVLFMDPPRAGADAAFLQAALRCAPARIVYISCNPTTQARDLAVLTAKKAYRVRKMQPVDMFPWTHHVENVVLLEKVTEEKPAPKKEKPAEPKAPAKHTRPSRRSQFAKKNAGAFGRSGKASDKAAKPEQRSAAGKPAGKKPAGKKPAGKKPAQKKYGR